MTPSLDTQLASCIHCGLCLNSCPTYRVTGDEVESPRGRLVVMHELLANTSRLPAAEVDRTPLDRCLGCRNCETVCPSGVPYGHLLEATREQLGASPASIWVRRLVEMVFPHPRRLAVAAWAGRMVQRTPIRSWLPRAWRDLLASMPARSPRWPRTSTLPTEGKTAVLLGCAQTVYSPNVVPGLARLAHGAGADLCAPSGQGCCGALHHHLTSIDAAKDLARRNIDAFESVDELLIPSAGCSAHVKQYGELLADDPAYRDRARALAAKTVDAVEWLAGRVGRLRFAPDPRRVVYHPPCHHSHAQGIVGVAERLLDRVPELERVEMRDADRCCGSAGSYSLTQPALARAVREEKLSTIQDAFPDFVLSANPGCELFIEQGLTESSSSISVEHVVDYLAGQLEEPGTVGPGASLR